MAQSQIDTTAIAKALASRIREAAAPQVNEGWGPVTKTAAARRSEVNAKVAEADGVLNTLSLSDRVKIEKVLAAEFHVGTEAMTLILKEASIGALVGVGSYWSQFYGALGVK